MRMLACLCVVLGLVACQKDRAEQSAEKVAKASPAPVAAPAPAPAPAPAVAMTMAHEGAMAPGSCGCGGAASCSGGCGESCAGNGPSPQWTALPADTSWQPLHVDGMMCGGCGKRIEKALANVDGVLAVKTDFHTKKVEIATRPGLDARSLVKPTIDGLGYRVQ